MFDRAIRSPARSSPTCAPSWARKFTTPSFRATCASRRRPRTASRCCSMTSNAPAAKLTSKLASKSFNAKAAGAPPEARAAHWRMRWPMKPPSRRPPPAPRPRPRGADRRRGEEPAAGAARAQGADRIPAPNPAQPAQGVPRRRARRARRLDPRARLIQPVIVRPVRASPTPTRSSPASGAGARATRRPARHPISFIDSAIARRSATRGTGRTITGWMTPRSRIEAASSSSSSSRNALRGCADWPQEFDRRLARRAAPAGRLFAGVADQRREAAAEGAGGGRRDGGFIGHLILQCAARASAARQRPSR